VHQNLQLYGMAFPKIAAAIETDDPFTALGYPGATIHPKY